MSNNTYVCEQCGELRRRPVVYRGRDGTPTTPVPECHATPMRVLRKGYAEAATKLTAGERVRWLAAGGYIVRKAGRRWVAAFSSSDIGLAREQRERYSGMDSPAI